MTILPRAPLLPERLNGGYRGTFWAFQTLVTGSMIALALLYGLGRLV